MKKIANMIDILPNPEKKQWDQYAAENVAAKYSHLFDWGEKLASTYGLPILRLAAIDPQTSRMTGILPLILFAPPGNRQAVDITALHGCGGHFGR